MAIYLKKFENHTQYDNYINGSDAILPNVSICVTEGDVHYNPYVEPVETRLVAKFNIADTSYQTKICNQISGFSVMEIDGVEQPSVTTGYSFTTTGEHIVKYTLSDPTSIGSGMCSGCTSLTSIDIPNSVTSIGNSAFNNCSSLTSIDIPSGVTSIGSSAFNSCGSLTSVTIPDSVTSIGELAFYKCSGLTSAAIGNGVTSIGDSAFSGCSSLTSIDIPDSVTSIGSQAFYYCSGLTSCSIGSGVTSIGSSAFNSCTRLVNVTIFASTPPTAIYTYYWNAFSYGTDCPIYVPNGSVDAYKAARGWNNYSSRIQPIV